MNFFTAILILITNISFADCIYTTTAEDFEANWTAFKTPSKVGVSGRFRDLGLKDKNYKGNSLKAILENKEYKINTKSVWTRNASRDAKIIKYFFTGFKNKFQISGKIKDFDEDDMLMTVNMNGIEKEIPMKVIVNDSFMTATGTIDVFDFALNKNLSAINKACDTLHRGKTWNDVDLELKVNFEKKCN